MSGSPADVLNNVTAAAAALAGSAQPVFVVDSLGLHTSPPADHTTPTDPQSVRLTDGTAFYTPTTPADTQPVSGTVAVSNLPATQPVSGPLTDSQLRASVVQVSGAFFQATQPISASALPLPAGAAQEHATAASPQAVRLTDGTVFFKPTTPADTQPVSGTFWQATQPVSGTLTANVGTTGGLALDSSVAGGAKDGAAITGQSLEAGGSSLAGWLSSLRKALTDRLPAALVGGRLDVSLGAAPATVTVSQATASNLQATVAGTVSANQGGTWTVQPGNTPNMTPWQVQDKTPNDQGLTATGAAAAGVTLTIPAPGAGLFQYLGLLEITMYCTAARTGGVTPTLVTSTNLPGNPVWTLDSAQAVGSVITRQWAPDRPIRASVANTAVTIVCPATTSVIWRVTALWTNAS